jgi:uncharacterized protein (DUF4415 family)
MAYGNRCRRCRSENVVFRKKPVRLVIRMDESGDLVEARPQDVTNYSLAARKAWVTLPNRPVGRRKGVRLCDRVSVTLRIDRDIWETFRTKESAGLIDDRTATINTWLRQKLAELDPGEPLC